MYYSAFGLIAILLLLIENQDILLHLKSSLEKPAWRVYRRFLYSVMAYYVTDILWGFLESRRLSLLLFVDTTVYFIAMGVGILFWVQYTFSYLDEKTGFGRMLVLAGHVLAGLITILATLNIFTPVLFSVSGDCVYQALPMRHVMLVCQIALLLLISVYALAQMFRRPLDKRMGYRTVALFGLMMGVFLSLQYRFPLQPLYTIAYLFGTSLLHTFVVNDEKAEYRRGMEEAARIRELNGTIRSLLDNMPGMTCTKDAETGTYLACNQAFAEYAHKLSPEEVTGLTDAQLFDEETAKRIAEDDRLALSMDEPYIFVEDATDADGGARQYQVTSQKYTDAANRLCILCLRRDVSDMVRVQREQATTKEAYEKARGTGIMYSHIAQSMTRGFRNLFYVNLDSEEYIEYRTDEGSGALEEVRRGWHFFEQCQIEAEQVVHPDDRAAFRKAMERKTLESTLDRNGVFVMTYRVLTEDDAVYVSMRVSRSEDDKRGIAIGVTDVDEQMKRRRAEERMEEERIAYARLNALNGDILCVYVVVPESGRYREFSASPGFESYARYKEGMDFFADSRDLSCGSLYPEDQPRFTSALTRENVLAEIARRGIFSLSYRLMMDGTPRYVQLKAAMVDEAEGRRLVVGILDIDDQVRQEEEYVKHLAEARIEANVDPLTGVKNRHAFLTAEEHLDRQIEERRAPDFAVAILDVNDLKKVNDTAGHQAGDQYLRSACRIICEIFKRSPVYRVGGDEFAVIAQGSDYQNMDELVERMNAHNREAKRSGGVVIACGMSRFENDVSVAAVFERADQDMYENKNALKSGRRENGR